MRQQANNTSDTAEHERDVSSKAQRVRHIEGVYALRHWMQQLPELFGTQIQTDCFVVIGMLTTHSNLIPALGSLYHRLPYAENSVRNHVRSLAFGGWISLVQSPGGDRRSTGIRLAPPFERVFTDYFSHLAGIALGGSQAPPSPSPVRDAGNLLHPGRKSPVLP